MTVIALGTALALYGSEVHGSQDVPARSDRKIVGIAGRNGRTLLTNMGRSTPTAQPGPTIRATAPPRYRQLISEISLQHGVDPHLTEAVIEIESDFNPNAVSSRGALGLMQLIRATGERFGVNNFFDPADNIRGGVRFLRFLMDKFHGDPDLVLAAYNSGENRVERLGRIPAIPETVDYVRKVRQAWERLRGTSPVNVTATYAGSVAPSVSPIYRVIGEGGVSKLSNIGSGQ